MDPCQVSLNDGLELSEEEKAHWQDQAEADKARYDLAGALLQAQLTHSRPVSIKLPAGSHVLPATLLDETTQATELWLVGEGHSTSLQLANEADHFTLMPGAPALHLVNLQLNGVPLMMNGSILHLDGCNVQGMATEAGRRLTEAEGSRALTVVGGQVIVSNSTFEGHTAGALLVQGGHLKMIGSRLRNNKAKTGAAIRVDGTGRAEVNSTEIEANDASESGGGVQVDGSGQLYLGNDTLLFNNKAPAGNGAAIRVASGGVRYTLPAPKGRYVFIQGAGAMISYIGKISCIDTDNGTTDTDGYGCSPMYYDYPERCGGYDDTDFTSTDMCCACDGGFISVDEIADVDDDYPTACPPGVYGSSQEPTHQSGPTCEAPCPAGFECLKGTVVPVNCSMGDYCPCAPRHLNQHILANLDSPVHIRGRTGSPAGVPCAEGKYGARRGLREAGECSECPPGHYCSSGNKIACTKDTYTDEADAMRSDISACHQCPSHAVSPAESAGLYSCECAARYFDNRTDYEIASDRGAANSTGARCVLCPVPGTICTEPNMTLERLPLKTGYWRVSTTSLDLRSCPDRGHNESGCVGGDGDPCKEELFGPYCLLCRNSTRFYDEEASTCLECGEGRGLHPVHAMLIFVGALASLLLLYYLVRRRCARRLQRAQTRLRKLKMRLSLQTRFKILWNFIVVATNMRKIYKVTLPNDVRWALNSLGVFALELKLFGPLECLGLGQYFDQLRTMLIGPLAATFVALGLCLLRRMAFFCMNRVRKGSESEETTSPGTLSEAFKMAWLDALPWMLMITFISSPTSYNRAFRAFDCDKFEDGSRHLVAEYRVTCDSEEYILIRRLAWANISLYALVVPALYAVLLKLASKAIIEDDETALSSALAFLYRDFRRDAGTLYWELVEVAKKEILAGFMVLLSPGELFQLAVAMNVAILFLFLQAAVEPYRTQADNFLALSTNFALVMFFLCAVFYKVASITDQLGDAVSPMVLATLRIDTVFLSSAMLIILAGSFCFGAFMLAHDLYMSARRARMERLAHIEAIKQRDACFLSHYKVEAGSDARYVRDMAHLMSGASAYLDSTDLVDLRTLFENGIKKSDVVVVIGTKGILTRPWCLMELWEAHQNNIPCVLFPVSGKGWDKDDARFLLAQLETELEKRNPGALAQVREHIQAEGVSDLAVFKRAVYDVLGLGFGDETEHFKGLHESVGASTQTVPEVTWSPWGTDVQILTNLKALFNAMAQVSGKSIEWYNEYEEALKTHHDLSERLAQKGGLLRKLSRRPAEKALVIAKELLIVYKNDAAGSTAARVLHGKLKSLFGETHHLSQIQGEAQLRVGTKR